MKILFTSSYRSPNYYLKTIADQMLLMDSVEVTCSIDAFWHSNASFEIIHIQWPEELIFWQLPSDKILEELQERIFFWRSKGVKIIATRHNNVPHISNDLSQELYDVIYNQSDAVIHLGNYSKTNLSNNKNINVVIQHPNYNEFYDQTISKSEAKKQIDFPENATMVLSLGAMRSQKEEKQLINAFSLYRKKDKNAFLVICNAIFPNSRIGYRINPLERVKWDIQLRRFKKNNVIFGPHKLSDDILTNYMCAADVVVAPRVNSLNSGVVFLGFTFGKPVVAPNIGNIKEIMEKTGNPTFSPGDINSFSDAIQYASNNVNLSIENKKFSDNILKAEMIAKDHFELYMKLIK